jgi:hypothetical protein
MAMVPKDGKVAVSEHELPHVSNRLVCYDLRDGYEGAEWMLYSEGSGWFGSDHAAKAMRTGEWTEVARRGVLTLIKKKGAGAPPLARP